jgi:predicted hydrocarbon binding protein
MAGTEPNAEDRSIPDFFIMPLYMFKVMHEVLDRKQGKKESASLLFQIGYQLGQHTITKTDFSQSHTENFIDILHLQWAEMGLGLLSIWTKPNGNLLIQNTRSSEALAVGQTGGPSCHFTRGYLAGIINTFTGIGYRISETKCICKADEVCVYEMTKV